MQLRVACHGQSQVRDDKSVLETLGLKRNQSAHVWIRLEGNETFQEFVHPKGLWIKKMEWRLYSFVCLYSRTMINNREKFSSFFILESYISRPHLGDIFLNYAKLSSGLADSTQANQYIFWIFKKPSLYFYFKLLPCCYANLKRKRFAGGKLMFSVRVQS